MLGKKLIRRLISMQSYFFGGKYKIWKVDGKNVEKQNVENSFCQLYSFLNLSGSTDGTCKWWDTRNLKQPVEELILDVTKKLNP